MMADQFNAKRWWETWWGQSIILITTGVIVGLIVWSVTRRYDKPTMASLVEETTKPPAQPRPDSNPPTQQQRSVKKNKIKIEQHGQASGAVGGNITQGPCGIVQAGGSNNQATTNCGPPEPKLSWKPVEGEFAHNAVLIEVRMDHSMELPAFVVNCDRPCETTDAYVLGVYTKPDFLKTDNPHVTGMVLLQPRPLGAGVPVQWRITPKEDKPLRVVDVRKMSPSELAMLPEGDR